MAAITITPSIGWFYASVLPKFIRRISDNAIQHCKLLKWMKEKGCIRYNVGGDGFQGEARLTESGVGGSTSDWGSRVAKTLAPPVTWTESIRQWDWEFLMNLWQLRRFNAADDRAKLVNMGEERMRSVRQEATKRMAQWLNGSGSAIDSNDIGAVINGLGSVISNTGTFMGLSRTTYSGWQSQIDTVANFLQDDDSDGVNNGLYALQSMYQACQKAKQGNPKSMEGAGIMDSVATETSEPDLILTTSEGWQLVWASLEAKHRFETEKAGPLKGIQWQNAVIAWDEFATANKFRFLNSEYLELLVVGSQLIEDLYSETKSQPFVKTNKLGGQGNLISRAPRYHGQLTYS